MRRKANCHIIQEIQKKKKMSFRNYFNFTNITGIAANNSVPVEIINLIELLLKIWNWGQSK